ncbi:MAG: hypothetical protein HY957_09720 [Nitrospirae bacterium]|nr:hypothetical protein [Nitrospirota bacterium]
MSKNNFDEYLKPFLAILSVIFLIYGFVHLKTYYGSFGIDVQDYFSLEDYLRANIDNIYKAIVPYVLGSIYGILITVVDKNYGKSMTTSIIILL